MSPDSVQIPVVEQTEMLIAIDDAALSELDDEPQGRDQSASNPMPLWVPSQKGFLSEAPQRQSAPLDPEQLWDPSALLTVKGPLTNSGPFGAAVK